MRIIERTNPINKSVLYVIQTEATGQWQRYNHMQLNPGSQVWAKEYIDISSHATLEEAKAVKYRLETGLKPGEHVVG